jgi:hypothetical protein
MGLIRLLLLPVFAFAFYMLPTIIAIAREKQNVVAIGLVNFFLGWSIIAWIIALVWSLSADPVRAVYATPVNVSIPQAGIFCQHCGKFSHSEGRFCPHCGETMQRERVRAAEVQLK